MTRRATPAATRCKAQGAVAPALADSTLGGPAVSDAAAVAAWRLVTREGPGTSSSCGVKISGIARRPSHPRRRAQRLQPPARLLPKHPQQRWRPWVECLTQVRGAAAANAAETEGGARRASKGATSGKRINCCCSYWRDGNAGWQACSASESSWPWSSHSLLLRKHAAAHSSRPSLPEVSAAAQAKNGSRQVIGYAAATVSRASASTAAACALHTSWH